MLDPQQLLPMLAIGGVVAGLLGVALGFGRRTIGVAVLVALGVNAVYPGGAAGLVVAVLRPFRALTDDTAGRRDARSAGVAEATGEGQGAAAP